VPDVPVAPVDDCAPPLCTHPIIVIMLPLLLLDVRP